MQHAPYIKVNCACNILTMLLVAQIIIVKGLIIAQQLLNAQSYACLLPK